MIRIRGQSTRALRQEWVQHLQRIVRKLVARLL